MLRDKRMLSASSQSRKLSSLRTFFKYLSSELMIKDNPLINIDMPSSKKSLPNVLSSDEVDAVLSYVSSLRKCAEGNISPEGIRLAAMVHVVYASGLRVSEMVSLKLSNINKHKMADGTEISYLLIKGKGGKERIAPLNEDAISALNEYIPLRGNFAPRRVLDEGWLFASNGKDGHITRQRFGQLLKQVADEVGIARDKLHPHALRHSFASHILSSGTDLRVVQKLLGHSDISTTEIYTHIASDRLHEVVQSKHPLAAVE